MKTPIDMIGQLQWIGLRPAKRAEMTPVDRAEIDAEQGLVGDHYRARSDLRQITLIQAEHLAVIAALAGLERVTPEQLRRNLVVSGINLAALRGRRFRVGEAVLETTGACHPCSRMADNLGGAHGYHAVRGHGGITARVLGGGSLIIGAAVVDLGPTPRDTTPQGPRAV